MLATSREPLGVPGELLRPGGTAARARSRCGCSPTAGAAARPGFRVDGRPGGLRRDLPPARRPAARPSNWPPPGCGCSPRGRSPTGSTTASGCSPPAAVPCCPASRRCGPSSTGPGTSSTRPNGPCCAGCPSSPAAATSPPPRPSARPARGAGRALGSLVDKSLVVAAPSAGRADGEMRYRLLETVAEYAGERLDESGERAAAERAPPHVLPRTRPHHRPEAARPRPARGHRTAPASSTRTCAPHCSRAVAERDEQEALCLVLSLAWYWQIRDLRTAARNWSPRGRRRSAPTRSRRPPSPPSRCTTRARDARRRCAREVLDEARRGVHLLHLACMDLELETWQTPEAEAKLRAITEAYRAGLPQVCRSPGILWFYAVMLTGDMDRLREVIDASVATCRGARLRVGAGRRPADARQHPRQPHRLGGRRDP